MAPDIKSCNWFPTGCWWLPSSDTAPLTYPPPAAPCLPAHLNPKSLAWALALPSHLKLDVTLMLLPGGEARCLHSTFGTLAGAEDNLCLELSIPATTNQEKRQSKQWSCKSWLDHSLWVRWFPGSLWQPPIPNPVYSLPEASPGPLACWDEQESHRVALQCSTWSTHPVAYWINRVRNSHMKEIRLSHKLWRRFGHAVTLALADTGYWCPLEDFVSIFRYL